jgi:hypothetical protein
LISSDLCEIEAIHGKKWFVVEAEALRGQFGKALKVKRMLW